MIRTWLPLAAALASACATGFDPWLEPNDLGVPMQRAAVAHLGGIGLSGSALDGDGRMWAIPERQRALLVIDRQSSGELRVNQVPLDGVPDALDAESLAWLGGKRFAIGTERRVRGRTLDSVLIVEVGAARARVIAALRFDYRELFEVRAPSNEGVEGLCRAGPFLVAAAEPVVIRDGRRYAPIARRELEGEPSWTPFLVELTSSKGKLSALDCWTSDGSTLHVIAVERHYGTTRVIHFGVPASGSSGRIHAKVLASLEGRFAELPNVEGVVRNGNQLILLTDHDTIAGAGATESILIGPFDTDDEVEETERDD